MTFQIDPKKIVWKLHLKSDIEKVFEIISTDKGRSKFWATTKQSSDRITFDFSNGYSWLGKILANQPPTVFSVEYIEGSLTTFLLEIDGHGGTDLTLTDEGVPHEDRGEVIAGWGSVLMSLKAAVDFQIDLRNHDPARTWDQGYFEN